MRMKPADLIYLTAVPAEVRLFEFCYAFFNVLFSWPEMTDIINILIRCEFAYHVEFGFICDN